MPALLRQLERCSRLLGDHLAAAVQVFGSAALGVIDLPPLSSPGQIAPAQLRAAATLFWTMHVEAAGLPVVVDALVDALWDGRLALPIGTAGARLARYRRDREDRFTVEERRAIYERLFGPGSGFPEQWGRLVEALTELGRRPRDVGTADVSARVAVIAQELAQALSDRAVGITGFAGREIVAHVRAALDLLRDPELMAALGGGVVWQILRQHAPSLIGRAVDPTPHVDRAQAGMAILEWVAAHAAALEGGELVLRRDDPVVQAAESWRAAGGAGAGAGAGAAAPGGAEARA